MYLGQKLGIDFVTEKEKELLKRLEEKEEEVKSLKTQLGLYQQIHKVEG